MEQNQQYQQNNSKKNSQSSIKSQEINLQDQQKSSKHSKSSNKSNSPIKHNNNNQNQNQSFNSLARSFFPKPKKPITQWKKTKTLFWELMGTAFFAYGVCAASDSVYVTLSLFASLIIVSPFSGGHLNPAISFAFFVKGDIGPLDFLFRVIGQVLGALLGGFLAFVILNQVNAPQMNGLVYYWGFPWSEHEESQDGMIWGVYNACFGEALGAFVFAFVVLLMTDKRTCYHSGGNSILVLVVVALGLHMGRAMTPRTGGGINPAFGFSLLFWKSIFTGNAAVLKPMWIYIIAPLGGAFVAGIHYNWIHFPLAINHDKTVDQYLKKLKMYQKLVGDEYMEKLKNRPAKANDLELQDIHTPLKDNHY